MFKRLFCMLLALVMLPAIGTAEGNPPEKEYFSSWKEYREYMKNSDDRVNMPFGEQAAVPGYGAVRGSHPERRNN